MPRNNGFSILELLVALAIIALLASLFVVSIPGLMDGIGTRPLPEILQHAVRESRYQAALRKEIVTLRFDHEAGAFVVADANGNTLTNLESDRGADSPEVRVEFFQILPFEGVKSLRREGKQIEIDAVRFHPDRSSTPFICQLDVGDVRSRHRYDPFSDLEIKDE